MANYYYINDFENQSGMGNIRHAACPVCGSSDNVSLDLEKGLVHCFTPGCECKGILIDKDRPEGTKLGEASEEDKAGESEGLEKSESTKGRKGALSDSSNCSKNSLLSSRYPEDTSCVPVYISDYRGVSTEALAKLVPVAGEGVDASNPSVKAVRSYLEQQHISLKTAGHFGLMAGTFDFADKDTGQKTTEGRSRHYSLCYLTMLHGECVNIKARAVDVKAFRNEKANKQLPGVGFNIGSIEPALLPTAPSDSPAAQPLIFVEGEKDVLSLYEAGYSRGVSVANGGGEDVRRTLAPFREWIDAVDDIVICGDADYAGRLLQMRLLYLFRDRARLATLPEGCKDISDVLVQHGVEEVCRVIREAKPVTPENLVRPLTIAQQIRQNLRGCYDRGYSCGYGVDFDRHLMFWDRGGLMVLTGYPGDGKSDFLYDLAAHLMASQHKRFTFASLEQPDNADAMAGVIRRLVGRLDMSLYTDEQLDPYIRFLDQYMNCFDIEGGDPSVLEIIDACTRNLRQFHPDFLVVDNYARLRRDTVEDQNETEFIRQLLVALQDWGLRHHVWVIVVAHPRKPQDSASAQQADATAVSGSAHWFNLADLGVTVKRVMQGDDVDYKDLCVWKVRDQRICLPGHIYLLRQPCGRYEVRASREEVEGECLAGVRFRDSGSLCG